MNLIVVMKFCFAFVTKKHVQHLASWNIASGWYATCFGNILLFTKLVSLKTQWIGGRVAVIVTNLIPLMTGNKWSWSLLGQIVFNVHLLKPTLFIVFLGEVAVVMLGLVGKLQSQALAHFSLMLFGKAWPHHPNNCSNKNYIDETVYNMMPGIYKPLVVRTGWTFSNHNKREMVKKDYAICLCQNLLGFPPNQFIFK